MEAQDYIPGSDAELRVWLENFVSKCEAYEAELGLDAETLAQITDASADFSTKFYSVNELKETLRGAVAGKDSSRTQAVALIRSLAKQFKAKPNLEPRILKSLNITGSGSVGPVRVITELTVSGNDYGVNTLKWNRNDNSYGTQFIIESSPDGTTFWELVDVVTRTDYKHRNQVPGERKFYRIRSKRAGQTSAACAAVVVYPLGAPSPLPRAA